MKRLLPSPTNNNKLIDEAVNVLSSGGLVIYPTETCYGIGAEATNPKAVEKLLQYKGNRGNKAISVAVSSEAMAKEYVRVNEMAKNLYRQFLPGPVTVVSESLGKVTQALVSDRNTLGIRIPDFPLVVQSIKQLGKPITATSANTSGKKPPYSFKDWEKYTSLPRQQMVDLFIDAGELPERQPSTVVDTTLNEARILRQGEVIFPTKAKVFVSTSDVETRKIGGEIMCALLPILPQQPVIIAIQGELGAGKTQLTKGIAQALGVKGNVPSPTYTIVREYRIKTGFLYHIDTWRLNEGKELWDLGLKEMIKPGNVVVIEWLQKVKTEIEQIKNAKVVWVDMQNTGIESRGLKVF